MKGLYILLLTLAAATGALALDRFHSQPISLPPTHAATPNWLVQEYGRKHLSQNNAELIIRDYFHDRTNGIFVDVGTNHYWIIRTTYYLEKCLGLSGVAVDAICDFRKQYNLLRPKTLFFCFYVSDRSDDAIDFFINRQNRSASTGVEEWAKKKGPFHKEKAPTVTPNDLLRRLRIDKFDFFSMDIEPSEPATLAGVDIGTYRPSLVCIEAHQEVRGKILDYLARNNYRQIHTYNGLDLFNYYFEPGSVRCL